MQDPCKTCSHSYNDCTENCEEHERYQEKLSNIAKEIEEHYDRLVKESDYK